MKISRFIAVAVFGLSLISQNSFASMQKATGKNTPKIDCKRSILPLFNKRENRPCKEVKHEKKRTTKHEKKQIKKHTKSTQKTKKNTAEMVTK